MKSTPLISVIVATYNQEKFIGRCLRSLLDQTLSRDLYEIIVIDDGSVDRTPYALELFHSAIRTITNDRNLGLPASLNKGILLSEAEFIIRVDSDDYVNANMLNFLHFFLASNDQVDAVACDYFLVNDNEKILGRCNCMESPIACGILFKRQQLIELGMYDEDFLRHEDQDLRIRFDARYTMKRLELPLYRYRRHESNITNDKEEMAYHHQNLVSKHALNKN